MTFAIEIVCVDVDGVKRCFSIAQDRDEMPLCPSTENRPTTDEEWYEELVKQANADEIREIAFKKSGRSLLKYGMNLVKNEMTTIDEVERVCLLNDSDNEIL